MRYSFRASPMPLRRPLLSFFLGTLFSAMEQTKKAGGASLEVFLMGMKLSAETGELVFDENLPDAEIERIKRKSAETGVRIINAYIGSKQWTGIETDESKLRPIFCICLTPQTLRGVPCMPELHKDSSHSFP